MELHHLRYFEAVARHGHVTRAAEELHIAQPSLSKQIRVLEAELGVALFDRVGRRVELTDAGRLLLPYARRIQVEVGNAREALRRHADLTYGHISLGAPPTVGTQLLPQALADFHARYSGIELELREAGGGRLLHMLSEGTVDLAVVPLPVGEMAFRELFSEELVLAVAQHHPLARAAEVRPAELSQEGFILYPVGYELRDRTLQLCRSAGFEPRVVLDGAEMDTVLRFSAVGLGVALVPRLALEGAEGLVGLRLHDANLTRTLGLIWHPQRQLSPAAATLRDFLIEQLPRRSTTQPA